MNFNADLVTSYGQERNKTIALAMVTEGLEDMEAYFLPLHCHWKRDRRTRSMLHRGQDLKSRMDYILGIDRHLFQNVTIQ